MKKCKICKEIKESVEFYKNKTYSDGLTSKCKECHKAQQRSCYESNITERRKKMSEWQSNNRGLCNKIGAKYRASKLQRTPQWLNKEDLELIKDEYLMAKKLEEITGDVYHVDHVVPLQGENVSGLHVPWNLQVIEASENLSKGNRYGT